MDRKISKKEFMDEVEKRLKESSLDNLQKILITWANELPPKERSEYLNKLEPPIEKDKYIPDKDLLKDIQEFYEKVEDSDYCTGWGWDDEIHEERDWGDESWAMEMDGFFDDAEYAFSNGDYKIAVDIYKLLFKVLDLGQESGHLPGDPNPENMLETDLDEARSCYLRAVYFTTPLNKRPAELFSTTQEVGYYVGDNLNLQSIINADQTPLPDFDQFLPAWIALLKKTQNQTANYLLREAVALSGGASALEMLAKEEGREHPRVFVDWINTLEKNADYSAMVSAAKEGLDVVPKDFVVRAEIAKGLIRAGEYQTDLQIQLLGWREAFYSEPNLSNFLSLQIISDKNGSKVDEQNQAIKRVISLLDSEEKKEVRTFPIEPDIIKSWATSLLLAQTYLLSGRVEDALVICHGKESIGWNYHYSNNPKGLVVPYLLRLLYKDNNLNATPNLGKLWEDELENTFRLPDRTANDFEILRQLMNNTIESSKPSNDEIDQYLTWCRQEICNRVDTIVSGKYRGCYHKAANLLLALAEVLTKLTLKSESMELVEEYRKKYNHHRAFQDELKIAKEMSNLF